MRLSHPVLQPAPLRAPTPSPRAQLPRLPHKGRAQHQMQVLYCHRQQAHSSRSLRPYPDETHCTRTTMLPTLLPSIETACCGCQHRTQDRLPGAGLKFELPEDIRQESPAAGLLARIADVPRTPLYPAFRYADLPAMKVYRKAAAVNTSTLADELPAAVPTAVVLSRGNGQAWKYCADSKYWLEFRRRCHAERRDSISTGLSSICVLHGRRTSGARACRVSVRCTPVQAGRAGTGAGRAACLRRCCRSPAARRRKYDACAKRQQCR